MRNDYEIVEIESQEGKVWQDVLQKTCNNQRCLLLIMFGNRLVIDESRVSVDEYHLY